MARPRLAFEETLRGEIYGELCDYATTHNVIPGAHSFWCNVMKKRGYTMSWSAFRWHWDQLIGDGRIWIDPTTGAVGVLKLKVEPNPDALPAVNEPRTDSTSPYTRVLREYVSGFNSGSTKRGDTECSITEEDVTHMLNSQKYLCWWCNRKLDDNTFSIDHRIPLAKGGSNELNNLVAACAACNCRKIDRMPWEFNGRLL